MSIKPKIETFACDARRASAKIAENSVDAIATEGMLGPPLRGGETLSAIKKTAEEIEALWRASLEDWKKNLKTRGRIVGAWPSFKTAHGAARVELDRDLARLGYRLVNPLEGWDDSGAPLLYHREGQHIARRIVVLEKS